MIKKGLAVALVALFAATGFVGLMAEASEAAGFDVTDGTGRTFHYDKPSDHVIVAGFAVTLTVVDLGLADKIVATDTYGGYDYYKDPKLEVLKGIPSIGSIGSSANNELILFQLVQWKEEGKISFDDTIIFTTYITNGTVLRALLEKEGFSHILIWGSITEYNDIANMVDTVSMALTGHTSVLSEEMRLVKNEVAEKTAGVEKRKAIFVWYTDSTGEFRVGKTGSLAVSMIEAAGGVSLGNSSASGGSYGNINTVIQLLENNRDALVLLDNSYAKKYGVEKFRTDELGGDRNIKILGMEQTWNNYCPESMDGLWAIAQALYPELFGDSERPAIDKDGGSNNTVAFIALGAVAAIGIIALAVYFMRKP